MNRPWCARLQYPKRDTFIMGTVELDAGAKDHDVRAAIVKLAAECFPPGYTIKELLPGSVTYNPKDGWSDE